METRMASRCRKSWWQWLHSSPKTLRAAAVTPHWPRPVLRPAEPSGRTQAIVLLPGHQALPVHSCPRPPTPARSSSWGAWGSPKAALLPSSHPTRCPVRTLTSSTVSSGSRNCCRLSLLTCRLQAIIRAVQETALQGPGTKQGIQCLTSLLPAHRFPALGAFPGGFLAPSPAF